MKALVLERPATQALPVLKDMPVPAVGADEVLPRVPAAAGKIVFRIDGPEVVA